MCRNDRSPLQAALAVELARSSLTQRDVAALLGVPDTTFSDWVRRVHPGPADLPARIESALGLAPGSLPNDS